MGNCCSDYIINLIKGSKPEDALKDTFIIKKLTLGISNLNERKFLKTIYGTDYVHTALFITNEEIGYHKEKGIVLEYGKYESKNNSKGLMKYEYANGGMRYGWCEANEFQKELASAASINLEIQPLYLFRDLIEKMKENDIWDLDAFSSINHNCQHFCAKAIKILGAEYNHIGVTIKDDERLKRGQIINIIPKDIRKVLLKNN